MSPKWVALVIMMVCFHAPLLYAEEHIPAIQDIIRRIEAPIALLDRNTSQEIAVAAYMILNNVPFIGLERSQKGIEQLIRLKQTLLKRPGMLERRLALRIQENIDCVLLAEVNRRARSRNKETVNLPYQEGFVRDETVTSLLEQNTIAELEHARYLLDLSGKFSQFFHRQQFEADDLLNGNAMRKLPSELETLRIHMYNLMYAEATMERTTMENFLVVYTFEVINRARDIRMLWEVFRQNPSFYLPEGVDDHWKAIGKVLSSSPYRRELITGMKKRAFMIVPSGTRCCDTSSGGYARRLLFNFLPYFGDMWMITAQHEGIFSWFCQSEDMELEELFRLKKGEWLEFDE